MTRIEDAKQAAKEPDVHHNFRGGNAAVLTMGTDVPSSFNSCQAAGKEAVRHPSKSKKRKVELDIDGPVRNKYQQWVNLEAKYNEVCPYAYSGMQATQDVPKKHRRTYSVEIRLEVCEYIAATGVTVRQTTCGKAFNIFKSTIQDILKVSQGVSDFSKGECPQEG